MTKAKATAPAEPVTDDTGTTHFPHAEGGPSYRTVCYMDGQPWPCEYAVSKGIEAPTIERAEEIAGPSIEGTNAHAITTSGKLTADELIEAGLPRDAATAIEAAQVDAEDED